MFLTTTKQCQPYPSTHSSLSLRMEAPFLKNELARLRKAYGYTCSVCLTPQTDTGSQGAHLFPKAPYGEKMVSDAISLGMLDRDSEYRRASPDNGTIQCPTCHAGFFTNGFLAFSPPLPILAWIMERIEELNKATPRSVWKKKISKPGDKHSIYDTFPGVIRLRSPGTKDRGPVNYWRLPVPSHIILYLFMEAIACYRFDHSFPEVALAMKIHTKLMEIRETTHASGMGKEA
ncbi:hypothetical protein B0H13DRAFT_1881562 [Mycena leptocephala]|nr:hypothetical protein B0H13DRAFT_1881562 [Mycena leptocephala]